MMANQVSAGQIITADDLNALLTQKVIQHQQLDSNASTITLPDIPQSYAHLEIVLSAHCTGSSYQNLFLRCNGDDGGSSYALLLRYWWGNGSSSEVYDGTLSAMAVAQLGPTWPSPLTVSIPCYSLTGREKVAAAHGVAAEDTRTSGQGFGVTMGGGLWTGTDPITSIELSISGGVSFVAGSVATLYGRP